MCGISGFQIPSGVKMNARALAHELLTQIEHRGSHASGFAYYGEDGSFGIYKNPRPGSQLNMGELPRDAKTVILHTRYATQGAASDNRNNHPVVSTDNRIALVHNGVISNDYSLRGELGITKEEHGEVDSLVIPSLIAQQGEQSLSKLAGYAAIAWLDGYEDGTLHIAKLKQSPVAYTHLDNGAFVFASTSSLLEMALLNARVVYGGVFELGEGRMITVDNGVIMTHDEAPRMSYSHSAYSRFSGATAGGHGVKGSNVHSPASTAPKAASTSPALAQAGTTLSGKQPVKGSEDDSCETTVTHYYEDLERWRKEKASLDEKIAKKALAVNSERAAVLFDPDEIEAEDDFQKDVDAFTEMSDEEWEAYVAEAEEAEEIRLLRSQESGERWTREYLAGEGFFIVDTEGDISHFPTLEDLEANLRWLSKMARGEWDLYQGLGDNMNWVNHIMDIGSVTSDGELESWVDDSADIDNFESPAVRNLQYIREGANLLTNLKGA